MSKLFTAKNSANAICVFYFPGSSRPSHYKLEHAPTHPKAGL